MSLSSGISAENFTPALRSRFTSPESFGNCVVSYVTPSLSVVNLILLSPVFNLTVFTSPSSTMSMNWL